MNEGECINEGECVNEGDCVDSLGILCSILATKTCIL